MRDYSTTNSWEYWIPFWSNILQSRDLFQGNLANGYTKMFSGNNNSELSSQAMSLLGNSREEFLADREHNEEREDSSYQRMVKDMQAAGLNPLMSGANPISPSSSSVGADIINSKLQVLGYILDLKNLDAKNRQITNSAITSVLDTFKKKF